MHRSLIIALALAVAPASMASDMDAQSHRVEVEAWHAGRMQRLQAPDGWLSLVGLHWVEPGEHQVGSAADNDIVLATGPARLGRLTVGEGTLMLDPDAASGVGRPAAPAARIDIVPGQSSIELLNRGERHALRVRDAEAKSRTAFRGIQRYPVDIAWQVRARFESHPPGQTIDIANVTGSLDPTPNPGRLHFEINGKPYSLEAVEGTETQLFLIIADRTSGRETYGAGRFVYVDLPVNGTTLIDFNRAYNPPCAFTEFSTCPLPPPENRLDLAVTAGEKKYAGIAEIAQ
jgi:uncharacterized protein (DUF1684 family)